MEKNIKIILLVIVITISFYFSYKSWNKNEEIKVDDILYVENTEELIVANSFETKILTPSDDFVKIDIKYPFFMKADKDFNFKIENFIKEQMVNHTIISRENWKARLDTQIEGDNIGTSPKNDEEKFTFYSDFKIIQSNGTYISFVLKYGGFSGGAHGYENNTSFNYDIKNNKIIELKDFFVNSPDYLNYISTESRNILKKEFTQVSEEDKENSSEVAIKEYIDNMVSSIDIGTEPKDENFSTFTFQDDKITIYFAQYQVGPYVIGSPEVQIDIK